MKKTLSYTARGLFSNGVGRKGAFPSPSSVEPDAQKKHPGKSREMPGCPLGWSANDGHQAPVPTGKQAFSGKTGKLQDVGRIFGDIRGFSGGLKNRGKRRFFFFFFSNRTRFWAEKAGIGEFCRSVNLPTHPFLGFGAGNPSQKTGINPGRNTKGGSRGMVAFCSGTETHCQNCHNGERCKRDACIPSGIYPRCYR